MRHLFFCLLYSGGVSCLTRYVLLVLFADVPVCRAGVNELHSGEVSNSSSNM